MAITQDQRTQLARQYGLIGANESAGGGLVASRLTAASQSNPGILDQWQSAVRGAGDPTYTVAPRAPAAAPTPVPQASSWTQDQNTNLGRQFGLLSPSEQSGGGLMVNRLTNAALYDPTVLTQWETARRAGGDTGYVAKAVRDNLASMQKQTAPVGYSAQQQQFPTQNYQQSFLSDVNSLLGQSTPQGANGAPVRRPSKMMDLPGNLGALKGLDPLQQRTAIASQGIYGGNLNKGNADYFLNSFLSQYLNPDNSYSGYQAQPVEDQYLQSLGIPFTDTTSPDNFLSQLATYYAQGANL